MPDAIFCRYCGQKREVETQSVQSINYNSLFSGPMSPSDGAALEREVAPALYGVGFSGSVAPAPSTPAAEVYTSVAAATPIYSGMVSGPATPSATPAAPVYHVDPALYGGPSGTMTPTPSGARVYHVEPPLYSGGLSGTVTPTSGGAPVYHVDPVLYSGGLSGATPSLPPVNAELGASVRGGLSGTVTPTSGGAQVITYPAQPVQAAQPGLRPRPSPMMMEPTTLAAQQSVASLPPDMSCEVPVTPTTSATSAVGRVSQLTSTRFSSYTPAPIQVSAVPTQASVKPCPSGPRLSVSIPTVPCMMSGWTPPALVEKQVPEPQVPPSLTAGLPDPTSIERQKNAYARGLEEQLRHGTEVLAQQLKQQSDYVFAMGDQRKRQFALQVDQEIKQREMELAQQHNEQLLLLQQAAQQQQSALEHQANALLLEYNQKKAQEDLSYQQYQFQKKQYETQLQYNEEMKELQVQQTAAQQQVAHQRACIAQQAAEATQQAQGARQARASAHPGAVPLGVLVPPAMYPGPQKTFAALP